MKKKLRLYTGGTFDLFHSGHVNFLKHCKKISDTVIVSLNSDDFVERYKGSKPIISYEDRKEVLLSCKYVDKVVRNTNGEDSKPTILSVKPDIIAIGDDWAKKNYYDQMNFTQDWLDQNNITLVYIPYKNGISSTQIKKDMKK
jgi:glycerol-3-phosphate cytidylyltransferase